MITLGTGLPGNGKTLFMLWYIAAKAKKETREVYYHNIKNLNTDAVGPWMEFEPTKWMELPHGAIIIIDECQEVFPKIPNGSKPPLHYEALAKHRHSGYDIFLITQHPTLIDNFARRLVGQHFHSIRKFGLQRAWVHEWSSCEPAPEKPSSHKNAVSMNWKFPKEVYGWYKSAEVHTVKRAIPPKAILVVLFIVAVPIAGWYAVDRYQHRYEKKAPDKVAVGSQQPSVVVPGVSPSSAGSGQGPSFDPEQDARQYTWKETPRLVGQQWTAPKYDPLTTPVRVPVPAACVQIGDVKGPKPVRCKCYSQQGTPMDIEFNMCVSIANNGYFREFDPEGQKAETARADAGMAVLKDRPDAPLPDRREGANVVVMADAGPRAITPVRVTGATALK